MARETVVSTSIVGIGYSASRRVLEVEFVSGGIYAYLDVGPEEHSELMRAGSKGQHVNRCIKPRHAYRRVGR